MSFKENSPVAAREGFPSALANSSTGASSLKGFWELCSSLLAGFSWACFHFAKYSGAQLSVKETPTLLGSLLVSSKVQTGDLWSM